MDLDKILNDALNKAMVGKNRIKQVNSNEIANFVNNYLKAINYSPCCMGEAEQFKCDCGCTNHYKNEMYDSVKCADCGTVYARI